MTSLNKLLFDASQGLDPQVEGGAELPISADDVNETTSKQFISGALKAQVVSNTGDIQGFGQRIQDLEDGLDGLSSTDELVKMDANDTASYLSDKLDGVTLANVNNQMVAVSLDGMTATVTELNHLTGATGNIQSQINSLSSITNFTEIVDNETLLPAIVGQAGATVLVREDSTQNGASTFYTSDGTTWIYINTIGTSATRDFTVNPINLVTESTDVLPKTRYEKQNSAETPFTDSTGNIQASNAEEAIKEVFQFSDNIRKQWSSAIGSPLTATDKLQDQLVKYTSLIQNIATAITEKGVPAYSYNKLNELPNKIASIPNTSVSVGLSQIEIPDLVAPHVENIVLSEQFQLKDVNTNLIEIVGGADDVTHYDVSFTQADEALFQTNEFVEFDNGMRLEVGVDIDMTNVNSQVSGYSKHTLTIDENDFETYNGFKVV